MKTPEKAHVKDLNSYPSWSPRFWHGMRCPRWWKLVAANRFQIAPSRIHIAVGVSIFGTFNDVFAAMQKVIYGKRLAQSRIEQAPIFILGHWRSGTTLLHELLTTNEEFESPNTYQCFAPSHFVLSEPLMTRFGNFLIPKKRPMDEMDAGWRLPQEDEFALMNLGAPSPYLKIGFPRTNPEYLEYLNMQGLSEQDLQQWTDCFRRFLNHLTFRYPAKRLVLKSPTHTGRIEHLYKMFPNAKFIHLVRDPRKLFLSTVRLWHSLQDIQSLQQPLNEQELWDYVTNCLLRMYEGFESGRKVVPQSSIIDVRYEDLAASPFETVQRVYEHLELGDFNSAVEPLRERLKSHSSYRTNRHDLQAEVEAEILNRWSSYAQTYGYAT